MNAVVNNDENVRVPSEVQSIESRIGIGIDYVIGS
jgi:hypothetical protein